MTNLAYKLQPHGKPTREQVFQMYPWLKDKYREMITHNDLDGMLTALILHHQLDWQLVGVYDLKEIHIEKGYSGDIRKAIFVDLDITHKDYRSIGHHILGAEEGDHLNINRLFNVGYNRYTEKFPLSTAMFLFWLFDMKYEELPDLAKLFLLHSDSMWKNYLGYDFRYRQNVTNWLMKLDMVQVQHTLQIPDFYEHLEKFVFPHTYSNNKQCTYEVKNGKIRFRNSTYDFDKYMDALAKIFRFKQISYPKEFQLHSKFLRKEYDIVNRDLEGTLNEIRKENEIFSYSVKFASKVDVTIIPK